MLDSSGVARVIAIWLSLLAAATVNAQSGLLECDQLADVEARLEHLRPTYAPQHPAIIILERQRDELSAEIQRVHGRPAKQVCADLGVKL